VVHHLVEPQGCCTILDGTSCGRTTPVVLPWWHQRFFLIFLIIIIYFIYILGILIILVKKKNFDKLNFIGKKAKRAPKDTKSKHRRTKAHPRKPQKLEQDPKNTAKKQPTKVPRAPKEQPTNPQGKQPYNMWALSFLFLYLEEALVSP
jgi:hypothetical protein